MLTGLLFSYHHNESYQSYVDNDADTLYLLNRNSYIFIHENVFEHVVWKWRPFCLGLNALNMHIILLCFNLFICYPKFSIIGFLWTLHRILQIIGVVWKLIQSSGDLFINHYNILIISER